MKLSNKSLVILSLAPLALLALMLEPANAADPAVGAYTMSYSTSNFTWIGSGAPTIANEYHRDGLVLRADGTAKWSTRWDLEGTWSKDASLYSVSCKHALRAALNASGSVHKPSVQQCRLFQISHRLGGLDGFTAIEFKGRVHGGVRYHFRATGYFATDL